MSRQLPLDRVEEPQLFVAEQDLSDDSWRIRLRCPVTGDIEGVRLSEWAAAQMVPDPRAVFIEWANRLRNENENLRFRGVPFGERKAIARRERGPLLNRLLSEAEGRGRAQLERYFSSDGNRATLKARQLLLEHLSPEQKQMFESVGHFEVRRKGTDTLYRITQRPSFNVYRLPDMNAYCGMFLGVPLFDQMLAQKLLIENDPDAFFSVANDRELIMRQQAERQEREMQQALGLAADPRGAQMRPPRDPGEYQSWLRDYVHNCGCGACRFIRANPPGPGAVITVQDLNPGRFTLLGDPF